jgi:hypothetical protein
MNKSDFVHIMLYLNFIGAMVATKPGAAIIFMVLAFFWLMYSGYLNYKQIKELRK